MAQCGGDASRQRKAHREAETVESLCQGLLDDDKCRAMFGYLQDQEWPDLGGMCYPSLGAPAPEASNGSKSLSCSGSSSGGKKRRPDACVDAKGESSSVCKRPRGKQQPRDPDQTAGAGKGSTKHERGGKKKAPEPAAFPRDSPSTVTADQKTDYIHVRARRGQATDSHSLAERVRRERISERMRYLQELVPGCNKVTGKAGMLDEIINYVQSLQKQVEFLSMKIAASNPVVNFNIVEDLFGRQLSQAQAACNSAGLLPPHAVAALPFGQVEPSCLQMSAMQQMQVQPHPGFGLEMVVNNTYPPAPPSGESCLNVNGAAAAAAWDIGSQNLFSGFDAPFQSVQSDCLLDNLKMEM